MAYPSIDDIDLSTIAPMYGLSNGEEPEYLDFDIKGRSFVEKLFYNSGCLYLLGCGGGTIYGAQEGLRSAPSPRMRVRVNALLNGVGKWGSRGGNAFGVLALAYTTAEWGVSQVELGRYAGGYDWIEPVTAGTLTGLFYKSTKGPKTAALAGVVGGACVGLYYAATPLYYSFMGKGGRRSLF